MCRSQGGIDIGLSVPIVSNSGDRLLIHDCCQPAAFARCSSLSAVVGFDNNFCWPHPCDFLLQGYLRLVCAELRYSELTRSNIDIGDTDRVPTYNDTR